VTGIAGRYATALFELALDQGAADDIAGDLQGLGALIDESDDLLRLVRSPVLTRAEQSRAMAAVLEKAGVHVLTRNFVGLIAANRRLFALPGMIRAYQQLLAAHRGEIAGVVISAHPLSNAQLDAVRKQLAQAMGQEVQLESTVDESLIGGLVVRVGSRMIDYSLRTKLQNLKVAMKGVD
jgi:F-type H+-transporting ATPase subunit delta